MLDNLMGTGASLSLVALLVAPFLGVIAWYATRSWTRS